MVFVEGIVGEGLLIGSCPAISDTKNNEYDEENHTTSDSTSKSSDHVRVVSGLCGRAGKAVGIGQVVLSGIGVEISVIIDAVGSIGGT